MEIALISSAIDNNNNNNFRLKKTHIVPIKKFTSIKNRYSNTNTNTNNINTNTNTNF